MLCDPPAKCSVAHRLKSNVVNTGKLLKFYRFELAQNLVAFKIWNVFVFVFNLFVTDGGWHFFLDSEQQWASGFYEMLLL